MKNTYKVLLALMMTMVMLMGSIGVASAIDLPPPLRIKVNGETIKFPDGNAYIDNNGRIQVPVRFVSEALGAKVTWDEKTRTASINIDQMFVKIKIGDKYINRGGVAVMMDTVAVLKNGRTYVPVRYIAESFGAKVQWDDKARIVDIVFDDGKEYVDLGGGYLKRKDSDLLAALDKNSDVQEFIIYTEVEDEYKQNLKNYDDVKYIISSKFGAEVAKGVYDHLKQKETTKYNLTEYNIYVKSTDQLISIYASDANQDGVKITVYRKGITLKSLGATGQKSIPDIEYK